MCPLETILLDLRHLLEEGAFCLLLHSGHNLPVTVCLWGPALPNHWKLCCVLLQGGLIVQAIYNLVRAPVFLSSMIG